LREVRAADAPSLARHANDRRIWLNLRDAFPHPYTVVDGERFVAHARSLEPRCHLVIAVEDEAVGVVGIRPLTDVERVGAEIGYWLGTAHWGRGITTAALRAATGHFLATRPALQRLFALPFADNAASCRVLEKAGYRLEGRLRRSAVKDGRVLDQLLYAITREEAADPSCVPGLEKAAGPR
jgi:RimJ/RimL family protein N-acetyltransferase